ncbi:Na(+)-translocating NADH-quinone reductase subunit C [Pseudaeromonas sharmana]|uniref:Na(+)-translocating NADH-quinone reductase subunit C n=1 Tax=Pseudaeromonas sharmana TaxID=328412 RepID=A0ABV8CS26_9GAMM
MASNNDSIIKTFVVVGALCLVCSILVAGAAVGLRPWQDAAKARDRQANILSVAGLPLQDVASTYHSRIEARLLDLQTGQYVAGDANRYDMKKASRDPALSVVIPAELDKAGLKRRAKLMPVYLAKDAQGQVESLILPIYGQGLWSTMYGFVSLAPDGNTVKGITYYDHGETPGLGSEIENPRWQALWIGKLLYGEQGDVALKIIKGHAPEGDPHRIDGLSGATLTSNGVQHTFDYWMGPNGYGPFLATLRNGGQNHG